MDTHTAELPLKDENKDSTDDKGASEQTVHDTASLAKLLAAIIDEDETLYAYEEEAPTLDEKNYFAAIMRSDPRLPFNRLHIGSMLAMEKENGLSQSHERLVASYEESGKFRKSDGDLCVFDAREGKNKLKDRTPLLRKEEEAGRVLRDTSPAYIRQVIGPDVLFAIRGKGSLPESQTNKRSRSE